jgi:hypothetical protein
MRPRPGARACDTRPGAARYGARMNPDEAVAHIERLGEAFAAADVDAALAAFLPGDGVLYAGSEPGECAAGRAGLRALFAGLFARDERYRWSCDSVVLAPSDTDVAVCAEARLHVLPAGEVYPYRICGVLAPLPGGGWAWRLFAGSEPTA